MKPHNARLDIMGPGKDPDERDVLGVTAILLGLLMIAAAMMLRGGA